MASLTVRGLPDDLKKRLRLRAAGNGRSVEEEIRHILKRAAARGDEPPACRRTGAAILLDAVGRLDGAGRAT